MTAKTNDDLRALAARMRRRLLDMALAAGAAGAHLGPSLSETEILAVLYGAVLRVDPARPLWPDRDRLILSKGHGGMGLYAALAETGFLSESDMASFQTTGSDLTTHPVMNRAKGIEFSNGSLGMGLSLALGVALGLRRHKNPARVFVLLGDGECDEGSVWEAAMAAAHYRLDSVIAVIDRNRMQQSGPVAELMETGDMAAKWTAFGWNVIETDGHDVTALREAFERPPLAGVPTAVVAHTVKGKGFAFCENVAAWHHGILSRSQYAEAVESGNFHEVKE